jgi:hypothetical protein
MGVETDDVEVIEVTTQRMTGDDGRLWVTIRKAATWSPTAPAPNHEAKFRLPP